MKRIGLLGGTSWPSTLEYYRMLNQLAAQRLGGYHSADLLLRSIDYHDIKSCYKGGWDKIPRLLEAELRLMLALPCDCIILCNNTLHKAFDLIKGGLPLSIPFFHAVELSADYAAREGLERLLLLGTRFTMEDNFFRDGLERHGLEIFIPELEERLAIDAIQSRLAAGEMNPEFIFFFNQLLHKYKTLDAVVLACTELPLAITSKDSPLRIIDPALLQVTAAIDFALD